VVIVQLKKFKEGPHNGGHYRQVVISLADALAWVSAMEGKRGPNIVGFLLLFSRKMVSFLVFKANSMFLPPLKIFALPWKKICGRPCALVFVLFQ